MENNLIEDISFLVFGCFGAIASGSMTMQLAKGKTLEEALKISEEDIVQALGDCRKIKSIAQILV